MKKKKYVMRKTVLNAIVTESLHAGCGFVDADYDFTTGETVVSEDKKCAVCAVGAVLRKAGFNNEKIFEFGDMLLENGSVTPGSNDDSWVKEQISDLLENKRYLHALSVKFEHQSGKTGAVSIVTRRALKKFVEKNFPGRIRLNPRF